jgi:prolyl oligopeptidase
LPESNDRITGFSKTLDFILITYMKDAKERTFLYSYKGKKLGELPVPQHASMSEISASREEREFFFEYVSYITSGVRFRYIPHAQRYDKYYESPSLIKTDDFIVKQEWFISKDGTKIPMFIVHHKKVKLTGGNPTILYGYGGYDHSLTPHFVRSYLPWLERGGIYVEANIRGGGEFGKNWHTSAMLQNKQRSYDDFIAAAEHLISRKYTDTKHLGISGGSNGGLLVSAVAMQRPELFRAVKAAVPLTDMVRFPLTHIASRWTSEYGDPSKAKDLAYILKYSPYHNVKSGTKYPAFLFTTGVNDTRVDPLHARKMAALLQASTSFDDPVLIYTDKGTGHTGSLTMNSFYENSGRSLAFFAQELDLKA